MAEATTKAFFFSDKRYGMIRGRKNLQSDQYANTNPVSDKVCERESSNTRCSHTCPNNATFGGHQTRTF
jgi:hypothetical protein